MPCPAANNLKKRYNPGEACQNSLEAPVAGESAWSKQWVKLMNEWHVDVPFTFKPSAETDGPNVDHQEAEHGQNAEHDKNAEHGQQPIQGENRDKTPTPPPAEPGTAKASADEAHTSMVREATHRANQLQQSDTVKKSDFLYAALAGLGAAIGSAGNRWVDPE